MNYQYAIEEIEIVYNMVKDMCREGGDCDMLSKIRDRKSSLQTYLNIEWHSAGTPEYFDLPWEA